MTPLPTDRGAVAKDLVTRVGAAVGRIARIQQDYALQVEAETQDANREALASHARAAAKRAMREEGITVEEYNEILIAAETDRDLEQRLLDAARDVL